MLVVCLMLLPSLVFLMLPKDKTSSKHSECGVDICTHIKMNAVECFKSIWLILNKKVTVLDGIHSQTNPMVKDDKEVPRTTVQEKLTIGYIKRFLPIKDHASPLAGIFNFSILHD